MRKLILASLVALGAAPAVAFGASPSRFNLPNRANVATWKSSLPAVQPAARNRVAAARLNPPRAAARVSTPSLNTTLAQVATAPSAADARALAAYNRLVAQRNSNPAAFDRRYPQIGQILAQDNRIRAAMAAGGGPVNGLLPDNAYWNYMRWRRSLNPANFDLHHPWHGPILARDGELRNPVPPTTLPGEATPPPVPPPILVDNPPIYIPPPPGTPGGGTNTPPGPPPGPTDPVPIPEPGSIVLMIIGTAGLGLAFRRRVRRAAILAGPADEPTPKA